MALTWMKSPDPSQLLSEGKWDSVVGLCALTSACGSGVEASPAHPKELRES